MTAKKPPRLKTPANWQPSERPPPVTLEERIAAMVTEAYGPGSIRYQKMMTASILAGFPELNTTEPIALVPLSRDPEVVAAAIMRRFG